MRLKPSNQDILFSTVLGQILEIDSRTVRTRNIGTIIYCLRAFASLLTRFFRAPAWGIRSLFGTSTGTVTIRSGK